MYLFEEKEKVEIIVSCKICLKEITFEITKEEFENTSKFPLVKEDIHGDPPHRLIVYINKVLEVENFKIKDIIDKDVSYSEELTKQVLSEIDLTDEEIELFFLTTGRDAVSLGEMALLIDKTKEECRGIAKKFVEKGLYKEIVGATPHFTALPPYAALVSQLQTFSSYISDVKTNVPPQLVNSFSQIESQAEGIKDLKEYTSFMVDLKENVLSKFSSQKNVIDNTISGMEKIRGIAGVISGLEHITTDIINHQMNELKDQFDGMSNEISRGMNNQIEELTNRFGTLNDKITQIIEKQIEDLTDRFESLKSRISENLKKLHLGVVLKTVERVIENLFKGWVKNIKETVNDQLSQIKEISREGMEKTTVGLKLQLEEINRVSKEGLEKTTESFNTQFISQLKESINKTVLKINEITSATAKSGEEVKDIFSNISEDFGEAVIKAGSKVTGITDNILQSFSDLKNVFSSEVLNTLEEVLAKILERLEISETTTKEFWEQAKKVSLFTMKNIWFIRSVEGVKAHIKDEVTKAKMRVMIVAPNITDIDVNSLRMCSKHVNIRIATNIDTNSEEHLSALRELEELTNVTYRHRELQNLWAMNRDYEQVILCVLSTTEVRGRTITEIAGLGSIIEEHIKIFVPILEEAWMSAKKEILKPLARTTVSSKPNKISETAIKQKIEVKPISPSTSVKTAQIETKAEEPTVKPSVTQLLKSHPVQPSEDRSKLSSTGVSTIAEKEEQITLPPKKDTVLEDTHVTSKIFEGFQASSMEDIVKFMEMLKDNIDTLTANEISTQLKNLLDFIVNLVGYSRVLDLIRKTSSEFSVRSGPLNAHDKKILLKNFEFWKKKLNI